MKPRKMRPRVYWATVELNSGIVTWVYDTRALARDGKFDDERVVRVRVTEAP